VDCPGYNHVLHNNVSFRSNKDTANMGSCNFTYNSFTPSSGVTVDVNDFMSTDEALLVAARNPDGSLPTNNFLRLKSTSDLLDKGMNLGFAFSGPAPDFGAFEYQYPNGLKTTSITGDMFVVQNGTAQTLYFTLAEPADVTIRVVDLMGRMQYQEKLFQGTIGENKLEFPTFKKGFYIVCIETNQGMRSIKFSH